MVSLTLAETTSQEVLFHRYSTIFHCVNCHSWQWGWEPSAIEGQSANILNWTRCSTNLLEMGHFRNSQCSHDIKEIWCRNYVARTRLSRKSLSSVKRIKCRVSENERNFLEIQCGKEKSNLWDGRYQLSDGRKGKKKGRTVPFMHCSNKANKSSRLWKRPLNVVGCLDVRLLWHFKFLV